MIRPPKTATWLLFRFLREDLAEEVTGDLEEKFKSTLAKKSAFRAKITYWFQVLNYMRPFAIRRSRSTGSAAMYGSYFKTGFRNLTRSFGYSAINIGGLALGLAVAMLIGLWIFDELTYNTWHANYNRIARVWVTHHFSGDIQSQWGQPFPLAHELRTQYPDFEYVAAASWSYGHFVGWGDTKQSREGMFVDPDFIRLLALPMVSGGADALKKPNTIILSRGLADAIFGTEDPVGKVLRLDARFDVEVTGVYEDLPSNCYFKSSLWLSNIDLYMQKYTADPGARTHWGNYSYQTFVLIQPNADFDIASTRIKEVIRKNNPRADSEPEVFLQPMSRWHLFGRYENGVNTGGDIQFVWLFGTVGAFVLLLACINFMNLSTARSERRAKEVGLRKAIGSQRFQLVMQFLSESLIIVVISFVLAIGLVVLSLGLFNQLTGKQIVLPWGAPMFWLSALLFVITTSLLAGSYPAFFLSSFNPIRALKGTFRASPFAAVPRKALVVLQFVVSVTLVTATIVVYQQIQFAKDRPIGYDANGVITTYGYNFFDSNSRPNRYDGLRSKLLSTGAVINMAKSSSPTTGLYSYQSDFDWTGRSPDVMPNFGVVWCTHDYAATIGLQLVEGRDFSRSFASDTAAIIINRAAVDFMGMVDPVGKVVAYNHVPFTVIAVAENVLMDSPYAPVDPVVYMIGYDRAGIVTMKLNPDRNATEALVALQKVFTEFEPSSMFEYQFADLEFARKFESEQRIGQLSVGFTFFAIVISALGLFGLASFIAQQRTKEIGIRKVVGASVFSLWRMLSREFVVLVVVASLIAIPLSWIAAEQWLSNFPYRTPLHWWTFAIAGGAAIAVTLLTVSYQGIKAARMNPVLSLRSE